MDFLPPVSPKAVNPTDKYLVINVGEHRIVESWPTYDRAKNAAHILTEHARRIGGKDEYAIHTKGASE